MNILAVEDEELLLDALELAIRRATPLATVTCYCNAEEALAYASAHRVDVAFLDVRLPRMDGMDAARQLIMLNPQTNIVFVTGFSTYMDEAFRQHASGYITKPVNAQKVRNELNHLRYQVPEDNAHATTSSTNPIHDSKLVVQCFGNFEAFVNGRRLECRSGRAMELLAYLVDRRGARVSVGEVETMLWPDQIRARSHQSQVRNLIVELRQSLAQADMEDILIRQRGYLALDTTRIRCDYWDFVDGKPWAADAFMGEYMSQYTWAEATLGRLQFRS